VGQDLASRDTLFRAAAQSQLIEDTVAAVRLDKPLDRKQRGGQRGEPQSAGSDAAEQRHVRPDRERYQGRDQQEERDRQPRRAGKAAAHVARDQPADHRPSSSRVQSSGSC
jgi:hypothetical protein